jgi:hypothetical protein
VNSAKRHKGECTNIIIGNRKKINAKVLKAKFSFAKHKKSCRKFRQHGETFNNKKGVLLSKIIQLVGSNDSRCSPKVGDF